MALFQKAPRTRRIFASLTELAVNGEKRCRSERAQAVTKRAREICGDGSCEEAESSVRIPLLGWFALSCSPSAKQQRPESDRSWKNEQSECCATAVGLGIDALYSDRHEGESKQNSEKRIKIECVNE